MKRTLPVWKKYWRQFSDLVLLKAKLNNLDETLRTIEQEFDTKLLSGDQMDLVDALENRITELLKKESNSIVQGELFEME